MKILRYMAHAWCFLLVSLCMGQTTPIVVATTVSCATSVDGTVVGLLNPQTPPVVAAVLSGTLPAGNYYTQIAWYDAAGHVTLVGPEVQTQLSGSGSLTVNLPTAGMPNAAVGMNVYIGAASGAETLQGQTTGAATFTQSTALASGAAVPSTNTTVCAVVANDAGWPTGTGYAVDMTTPAGSEVPGFPMQWQLLGPGQSINLGNGYPRYNGTVTYGSAIDARPYNHAAQSISGPLSMTGYKLTQVSALDVGTSVPAWPIDVENGAINANGGYIFDGGIGVTAGNCLIAGSDSFKTFKPGPCGIPPAYYQQVQVNETFATQAAILGFSQRFTFTNGSNITNMDLNAPGTGLYVVTETANPGNSTNCATFDGNGNVVPSAFTSCAVSVSQTDKTGIYLSGITYTNGATPVMEEVGMTASGSCTGADSSLSFTVNGAAMPGNGVWNQCSGVATVTFLVPAGATFSATATHLDGGGTAAITKWLELPL